MFTGLQQSMAGQIVGLVLALVIAVACIEALAAWALLGFQTRLFTALNVGAGAVLGWAVASGWRGALGGMLCGLGFSWISRYGIRGRWRTAILFLAPSACAVFLLVIVPVLFELRLAFADLNLYTIRRWLGGGSLGFVGLDNFVAVLKTPPLQTASFLEMLWRTLVWTGVNVVAHALCGLGLALLLTRVGAMGRGIYRTLLIIPWAMPQVIAVLTWRGEFHPSFGYVNSVLGALGFEGVNWWSDPLPVFLSCCIVNIWLGIPFMMVVFLGGLQNIPRSLYEAASMDGAGSWYRFWHITLPLLKPVALPAITLGVIWTFNNINVIYLMTGQNGGNEYADILVSALYKSAFSYSRYSYSAAFAVVILLILLGLTWTMHRLAGTDAQEVRA